MNRKVWILGPLLAAIVFGAVCGYSETVKIDGTIYENVKWGKVTAAYVSFFHKRGVTKVLLSELSPALQERFNYVGGEIRIKSKPDRGTKVFLKLPFKTNDPTKKEGRK